MMELSPATRTRSHAAAKLLYGAAVFAILAAAVWTGGCQQVSLTAPSGATIQLSANATTVALNGRVTITAIVLEQGGVPVNNGTVITFTANLGSIDPSEARTHNGRVDVTFFAGNKSGKATINAVSGPAKAANTIDLIIGAAAVKTVQLSVDPLAFRSSGGTARATSTVLDDQGNRLPGIPVTFTSSAGQVNPSGSVNTDDQGQASATISVRAPGTVKALAGTVSVESSPAFTINVPPTVSITASPSSATLPAPPSTSGASITYSITSDAGTPVGGSTTDRIASWSVDFGDGNGQSGSGSPPASLPHTYFAPGQYPVSIRVVDTFGEFGSASTTVVIIKP